MKSKFAKKLVAMLVSGTMTLSSVAPVAAQTQTPSLCTSGGILFGFFNGVLNTEDLAKDSLLKFEKKYGSTSPQGAPIRYEVFYNETEGFSDFVEVFEQRLNEHGGAIAGRFELFFSALQGGGPWWETIIEAAPALGDILDSFVAWLASIIPTTLTKMMGSPSLLTTQAEHRTRLDNGSLEGRKMLLVAHSQGNLFLNSALEYASTRISSTSIQGIHIAPASSVGNRPHVLADKDLVINALRLVGSVPGITDNIPPILERTPGLNGLKDAKGHGLLEIYLHPGHQTASKIHGHIMGAFSKLQAAPSQATSGFFTATMTWNGPGIVDLHVMEPSGTHVYFENARGQSGRMAFINRTGNTQDQYIANCDTTQLAEGKYSFSLANYGGAQGSSASVQIASNAEGVLDTRTVTMGPATLTTPSIKVLDVTVAKDPRTGRMTARIGNQI
ncbi:MAG: hypothetical protein ACYC4S_10940 [Rhodoferax sp.]